MKLEANGCKTRVKPGEHLKTAVSRLICRGYGGERRIRWNDSNGSELRGSGATHVWFEGPIHSGWVFVQIV